MTRPKHMGHRRGTEGHAWMAGVRLLDGIHGERSESIHGQGIYVSANGSLLGEDVGHTSYLR
jgi:hypothetical protein